MRIRNYQAETVSRALRLAKEELGPDAVILRTARISPEGPLRRTGMKMFQVTACVDDGMLPGQAVGNKPVAPQPTVSDHGIRMFGDILSDLRRDVRYLVNLGRFVELNERIDSRMVPHYTHLVSQGIDPELAESVTIELQGAEVDADDCEAVRRASLDIICKRLAGPSEIKLYAGRSTCAAMVGPPGSGKTALVAKLASHFVVDKDVKATLVSVDDFKPTAAAELERFGSILRVPCLSGELPPKKRQSSDVILVDTAGVPVGAVDELELLRNELSRMNVDEVHLVLPAFCGWEDLRKWYDFFKPLQPIATAMTFLDQVAFCGAAINLAILEETRFSYFSKGRTSAADLEPASVSRLAKNLIGTSVGES
jgi:flagellar biosynthesis protein FlhF